MKHKNTTFSILSPLSVVREDSFIGSYEECCLFQAGVIEEIVNDAVDTALDSEDIEDEIEEEVDKVLTAIAGETAAQLPEAARKERVKQPAQSVGAAEVCVVCSFSL